mmetsp:Transcript_35326/g.51791  ORF Transcript_35326/g.51791 Transcript_35326/m.51791 type:complete len:111 (+) Transcript_35326:263-595(+)
MDDAIITTLKQREELKKVASLIESTLRGYAKEAEALQLCLKSQSCVGGSRGSGRRKRKRTMSTATATATTTLEAATVETTVADGTKDSNTTMEKKEDEVSKKMKEAIVID